MIKTIPWDKVDIEVILLDNIDAEKVNRNRKYSQINHPGIRSENPIPEIEHKLCSLLFNYMLRKPILWPKNLSYGLSKHYSSVFWDDRSLYVQCTFINSGFPWFKTRNDTISGFKELSVYRQPL